LIPFLVFNLIYSVLSEWFTLMNKDKYAGEVYIELTFWSNVCRCFLKSYDFPYLMTSNVGTSPSEKKCAETLFRQ